MITIITKTLVTHDIYNTRNGCLALLTVCWCLPNILLIGCWGDAEEASQHSRRNRPTTTNDETVTNEKLVKHNKKKRLFCRVITQRSVVFSTSHGGVLMRSVFIGINNNFRIFVILAGNLFTARNSIRINIVVDYTYYSTYSYCTHHLGSETVLPS